MSGVFVVDTNLSPILLPGGISGIFGADGPPIYDAQETKEYVAGGVRPNLSLTVAPSAIPQFDVLYVQYGDLLIDWMLLDPMASSSLNTIKEGVLADGIHCVPMVLSEPEGEGEDSTEEAAEDEDAKLAKEIAEYCNRQTSRPIRPTLTGACHELLDAMAYMSTLAEVTWAYADSGPDQGRAVLETVKPKPRWAWAYVLDRHANIPGFLCSIPDPGLTAVLPRDKFLNLCWMPRNGDPRGTSLFRPAFNAWNVKLQVWPQYFIFMMKLAAASLIAKTPQNAQPKVPRDPQTGNPIAGAKPVCPQKDLADTLTALFQNASVVGVPFGTEVQILGVTGDGAAFRSAFTACDREIVSAILQATRITMEAEHGSKADSQTAQDVLGLVVRITKMFLAAAIRNDVLRPLVAANWGPEIAARLTPRVLLGDTDHQDFAAYANAIAALMQAGYFTEDQLAEIDQWLGVPVRKSVRRPEQITATQVVQPAQSAA